MIRAVKILKKLSWKYFRGSNTRGRPRNADK